MTQCKLCTWLTLIAVIIVAFVAGLGINLWTNQTVEVTGEVTEVAEHQGWVEYKSDKGFSFKHPEGYGVNETNDPENPQNTIVHIVVIDETGDFAEIPPFLQINVSSNLVSFALWEGREWEGYPDIIRTFSL
jgi:hypothetical protein